MALRRLAAEALIGVGDLARGQWEEWTGRAYHLRRRLSADEQALIGPALDCRGSDEGWQRLAAITAALPPAARRLAEAELASAIPH